MSPDQMVSKAFSISSFTAVGHLLHINLRDHLLQHKYEIGQALLNKNQRALAVVNKVNSIDNTYRNFDIEILAKREGCTLTDDELMICEVNENKCRFKLDFSKVYWNSRLSTEHERIVAKLSFDRDIVFDLFAGVGPFAVPAAKAKCLTFANDLNPESVKWLEINMKRNKVPEGKYRIFNKDAKDFIVQDIRPRLIKTYQTWAQEEPLAIRQKIHILMNLPALAPTFLPHFVGLLKATDDETIDDEKETLRLFKEQDVEHLVYCYCFLKGAYDDPKAQVRVMIEQELGRRLKDEQLVEVFRVRNVAPFKDMYRLVFRLDERLLFNTKDLVGIMKNSNGNLYASTTTTNGIEKTPKKAVTISDESPKKRSHDETATSSTSSTSSSDISLDENDTKRARTSYSYCSLM